MACLGAIEILGWPLDRIVTADVWATDTIPADLPPMVEFKEKADAIIKERWGIEVEHICAMDGDKKRTYEDVFYRERKSSKNENSVHKMYGWPFQKGPWCNDRLKTGVLKGVNNRRVAYIGIAVDEPKRFHTLSETRKSPLVSIGWTEADCRKWCEQNSLLSPIYTTATRGGCWFCHNQGVDQLRLLRRNYPDLWSIMLKWDNDSPVSFKAGNKDKYGVYQQGHTVHDYDIRFALEDAGRVPSDKRFRWKMLSEEEKN